MKTRLLLLLLLCLLPRLLAEEPVAPTLTSGAYVLTLNMPTIPADAMCNEIVGAVKVSGDAVAFDTKGSDGKRMAFSGKIAKGKILLWFSGDERDYIVTFHLSGSLTTNDQAQGSVSIFQTHERVAQGTWMLKRK